MARIVRSLKEPLQAIIGNVPNNAANCGGTQPYHSGICPLGGDAHECARGRARSFDYNHWFLRTRRSRIAHKSKRTFYTYRRPLFIAVQSGRAKASDNLCRRRQQALARQMGQVPTHPTRVDPRRARSTRAPKDVARGHTHRVTLRLPHGSQWWRLVPCTPDARRVERGHQNRIFVIGRFPAR